MAEGGASGVDEDGRPLQTVIPLSPPTAEVDETPIQKQMDKNKESLKVKLMLRRPITQLVDQGIIPPLKSPQAYHEQSRRLERAKMGDMLKAKIQRRPERSALVQQHILEDTGKLDPSLAERSRQLKKARLQDALNDQLSHRPGPLELIKGNILHPSNEDLERAVKEGQIHFKKTCEGDVRRFTPNVYVDEDSSSDALSPASLTSTSSLSPAPSMSPFHRDLTQPPSVPQPQGSIPGKDQSSKNRKKSKAKAQPKTRTIKFHEYKGPPNAQKKESQLQSPVETSYELLLQQQQMFLQWHLECQQKYPAKFVFANAQKKSSCDSTAIPHIVTTSPASLAAPSSPPTRSLAKLEDMKVSDLKAELKKRNLPVSGSKPQLIERLKPYSDVTTSAASGSVQLLSQPQPAVTLGGLSIFINSPVPVKEERPPATPVESPASPQREDSSVESPKQEVSVLSRPASTAPMDLDFDGVKFDRESVMNNKVKFNPNEQFLGSFSTDVPQSANISTHDELDNEVKVENPLIQCATIVQVDDKDPVEDLILHQQQTIEELQRKLQRSQMLLQQQTLQTWQQKIPEVQSHKQPNQAEDGEQNHSVKSQDVDDVLEILIRNGELSPSAAHDPGTPRDELPYVPPINLTDINWNPDAMEPMELSHLPEVKQEPRNDTRQFMDYMEFMDVDVSELLDNILPPQCPVNVKQECSSYSHDMDSSDPLLSHTQSPFDILNIDDADVRLAQDITSGWDIS